MEPLTIECCRAVDGIQQSSSGSHGYKGALAKAAGKDGRHAQEKREAQQQPFNYTAMLWEAVRKNSQ